MPEDKPLARSIADFIKFLQRENKRKDVPDVDTLQSLYWKQWGTLLATDQIRAALAIVERDHLLEDS